MKITINRNAKIFFLALPPLGLGKLTLQTTGWWMVEGDPRAWGDNGDGRDGRGDLAHACGLKGSKSALIEPRFCDLLYSDSF